MSDKKPIVSVIMPCYNQGQYLNEAIASVFAQTLQSFEIIIVNDGSTDPETIEILNHIDKPKITILHTENRGVAAARNTAIEQAQGEYILPLDADDRIAPTYLEKGVQALAADSELGIVYCEAEFFGEKTGKFELPEFNFPGILLGNMIFNSSFYRRADWQTIGGYRDNYHGWEDYDFWLSLLELDRKVYRIPELLYFYRQTSTSRSNSMRRQNWIDDYVQLFANHPSLYQSNVSTLFETIVDLRENTHQTHYRLHLSHLENYRLHQEINHLSTSLDELTEHSAQQDAIINETQAKLDRAAEALHQAESIISGMQSSKFWRLRDIWFEWRHRLGLSIPGEQMVLPPAIRSGAVRSPRQNLAKVGKKVNALTKVWQERGAQGFLQYVLFRVKARWHRHSTYQEWIEQRKLTKTDLAAADRQISQWQYRPVFSIILPVYNVEEKWLTKAIASVRKQIYPDWQLCIADDASPASHIKSLLTRYSKLDSRIKIVLRPQNGNIVAASNSALELATGDYIALLDHDDELAIDALFEVAKLINQHPNADFIYTDEDKIDTSGKRCDPFFKPDWSPDYFHSCMYTCHLGIYRTSLIRKIGGFRPGYDGSQDYDLVLRIVEQTQNIYHLPKVLYHWRIIPSSVTSGEGAKPWAYEAAKRALADMVVRSPYPGRVEAGPSAGFHRIRRDIIGNPLISIVIPSAGTTVETAAGKVCGVETCIRSIRDRSTYRNFEIVLVDGFDVPDSILQAVQGEDLQLVRCKEPFNFAQRINLGCRHAKGEILLLLNDDMEVITPDWLESMLEFAQQKEIGAVGAKLFFLDRTLQHTGVMILGGNPGHAFRGAQGDHPGYYFSNSVNRNYLAVTAACLMIRRSLYFELDGMDEGFPLNYNDVDLCLKVHQAGYRNVVTPYAQLFHYESASREPGLRPKEWENLNTKWADYFKAMDYNDPYYNPNLSRNGITFEL
jgi:O-antigen biosynthesis protein